MSSPTRTLGVIGGSGLYELEGLTDVEEVHQRTPFGAPSDVIVAGTLGDTRLLFLPRHGRGHRLPPHRINYRANVLALKMAGAEQILSISAVGSMKDDIHPGDMVVVDQFIDRTRHRIDTFFDDDGVVAHVGFAHPIDAQLASALSTTARRCDVRVHEGGTYLCMEGPQFSTLAESKLYRSWGVSVIGMTNFPEARLAREAELPYATLAMVTDYDSWKDDEQPVTAEAVVEHVTANADAAKAVVAAAVPNIPSEPDWPEHSALDGALMTDKSLWPEKTKLKLEPIIGRFL